MCNEIAKDYLLFGLRQKYISVFTYLSVLFIVKGAIRKWRLDTAVFEQKQGRGRHVGRLMGAVLVTS